MEVSIGIIVNSDNQVLVGRIKPPRRYAYLWEYPGGKVEPGESPEQALWREFWEEVRMVIDLSTVVKIHEGSFEPVPNVELAFFLIRKFTGTPMMMEHNALAWVHINAIFGWPLINQSMADATHKARNFLGL